VEWGKLARPVLVVLGVLALGLAGALAGVHLLFHPAEGSVGAAQVSAEVEVPVTAGHGESAESGEAAAEPSAGQGGDRWDPGDAREAADGAADAPGQPGPDAADPSGGWAGAMQATHPLAGYQPMPVEPVEPRLPAPPAFVPAEWRGLHEAVYAIASQFTGRLSVVAVDLTTGSRYEFRPRDPYLPASTFKLPVALCVLEAIDRGELTWDTPITYTEADWEPVGAGRFADAPFGSQWTVRNLVDRSIISSNNVAVKMLARTLTWDGLLKCTTEIGGPVTRTEEGSTPVTARDEAAWWLHFWRMSQERPELAEELLRPFRRVDYHGRIEAGTPRPELVTHKFGSYAGYEHDGAIVWAERPYLLVVLTFGGVEYEADTAIQRIAAAAWDAMMNRPEGPEGVDHEMSSPD